MTEFTRTDGDETAAEAAASSKKKQRWSRVLSPEERDEEDRVQCVFYII